MGAVDTLANLGTVESRRKVHISRVTTNCRFEQLEARGAFVECRGLGELAPVINYSWASLAKNISKPHLPPSSARVRTWAGNNDPTSKHFSGHVRLGRCVPRQLLPNLRLLPIAGLRGFYTLQVFTTETLQLTLPLTVATI